MPCGNTVALVGVDQFILKSGTITTLEDSWFVSFNLDGLVQVEGEQFLKGERIRHERLLKTVEVFFCECFCFDIRFLGNTWSTYGIVWWKKFTSDSL